MSRFHGNNGLMSVFRILLDSLPSPGTEIIVPDDQAHHLVHVRRLSSGDTVVCLDRAGVSCEGVITITDASQVTVRLAGTIFSNVSPVQIELYPALLPEKKFDWLLQKCTEVGVYTCRPVFTEHSIVKLPRQAYTKKLTRWQRICDDAARQCGGAPMQVREPVPLAECFSTEYSLKIIADRNGKSLAASQLSLSCDGTNGVALLTGPEGGFSDEELSAATASGWQQVSFHHTVLRSETAAVVCSTLLMHLAQ